MISFGWKHAGLISVFKDGWAVHLFPMGWDHWIWGKKWEDYDLICVYYGLGPLFLLVVPNPIDFSKGIRKIFRGRPKS